MRTWIIAVGLCIFCFILPLQCFIIGDDNGFGVQGAVFRYQMTGQGNSLIPVTRELTYITSGIYSGKTALSVILWTMGTVVLALMTTCALSYWNGLPRRHLRFIVIGLTGTGILYLASCIAQYGLLLYGPAGVSLPLGVLILFLFAFSLHFYQNFIYTKEDFSVLNGSI